MAEIYDPLSYENLARSVVTALMEQAPSPLPPLAPFDGAGVYALYYMGDFPAYRPLALSECKRPIYVGKAIPVGGRKGLSADNVTAARPLFRRLTEHAKSIEQAENLRLGDFLCRYLVVVPVWVTLAERFLVSHYKPVWNTVVDGFGDHAPGRGRRDMRRPMWDVIHPGRPWARMLQPAHTAEQVLTRVKEALEQTG